MDIEVLRQYALQKEDVEEGFPFGDATLVFKVKSRIFLLISMDSHPMQFNVKCNPEKAVELRETYPDTILPGYHMNKKHWNTVIASGQQSVSKLKGYIDDSYELVKGKKKGSK